MDKIQTTFGPKKGQILQNYKIRFSRLEIRPNQQQSVDSMF